MMDHLMEDTMTKISLYLAVSIFCLGLHAFECNPFGPDVDQIRCANLNEEPSAFGVRVAEQELLVLLENGEFNQYQYYAQGLPISGICRLDENTLMVAMGAGSYSDGVYNFALDTHQWTLNEWFFRPSFITHCPSNGKYYVGERDGLYHSSDAINWYRITALGMNECTSLAWHGQNMVCNSGNAVYISSDAGVTWQQSSMSLLSGFRFTDSGTLYAFMAVESDSDGLWRSHDYGNTWEIVFYSSNLAAIGPNFDALIPLGWSQPNQEDCYLALLNGNDELIPLEHADLMSPVVEIEPFPLINTPSFYVINGSGIRYLTNFGASSTEDALLPSTALSLSAYPNPARERCQIKLQDDFSHNSELSIYNSRGQLIRRIPTAGKRELSWDLRDEQGNILPSGIYLMRLTDQGGRVKATSRMLVL
jgi:hypothetical protein